MAITIHNRHRILGREWWTTEWAGLSTDDKATIEDVKVNDLFFEEDTGDFYYVESQGSKGEPTKNVLISEQSISEWEQEAINLYSYTFNDFLEFPDTITVVFDGTEYTVEKQNTEYENEYFYGGYADGNIDFSTYPFAIFNGFDEDAWAIQIFAGNNNEHTVEIYTLGNGDTPAVWKKVGSGGSEPEPSGEKLFDGDVTTVEVDGIFMYEFSPMLALNYSSIIVEFDGTRYTVQDYRGGVNFYAFGTEMNYPFDFDEYPFGLVFGDNGNQGLATYIFTESSGTYSLKIWANSEEGEMPVPSDPLG